MSGALKNIELVRRAREKALVSRAENLRIQLESATIFDTISAVGIRPYHESDYDQLVALYKQSELYGGQFDENRDSRERLKRRTRRDPNAILVAKKDDQIVGTISLVEDGRVAWLFRFCVIQDEQEEVVSKALFDRAKDILHKKGHRQVLVYTPTDDQRLQERYEQLGMNKGGDYTCYWRNI